MKIDIIILAYSDNTQLIEMTQRAINSCHASSKKHTFDILIIESKNKNIQYQKAKTIFFEQTKFNYNKALNFGISKTTNDYILLANNDLIFHEGWADEMISQMQKNKLLSASPYCETSMPKFNSDSDIVFGYELRKQVAGWALVVHRKVFELIGKLNEEVEFWRSDDMYIQQIKFHKLLHAVIPKAKVTHLDNGSKTLKTTGHGDKTQMQYQKFLSAKIPYRCKFSVIVPSFLGMYAKAATNRLEKFHRAIKSVLEQSYTDFEIVIVADGCEDTVKEYRKHYQNYDNIFCLKIPKQPYMSGLVRHEGVMFAGGEYCIYIDTDDKWGVNHLQKIANELKHSDLFVYYDTYVDDQPRQIEIANRTCCTGSMCHKRILIENWKNTNGYGHDVQLIESMVKYSPRKLPIQSEYYNLHLPSGLNK